MQITEILTSFWHFNKHQGKPSTNPHYKINKDHKYDNKSLHFSISRKFIRLKDITQKTKLK